MQVTFSQCPQQLIHSHITMPSQLESKIMENTKSELEVARNHHKIEVTFQAFKYYIYKYVTLTHLIQQRHVFFLCFMCM